MTFVQREWILALRLGVKSNNTLQQFSFFQKKRGDIIAKHVFPPKDFYQKKVVENHNIL